MAARLGRRDLIKTAGGLGAGLLIPTGVASAGSPQDSASASASGAARKRALRFAHFTDVHLKPERGADRGLTAALHHAQNLDDPPEMIFNGGDAIMDALGQTRERTRTQWDLWHSIMGDHCSLPVEHCIGNHDIWGWY